MDEYFNNTRDEMLYGKLDGKGEHVVVGVHPYRVGLTSRSLRTLETSLSNRNIPFFQFAQSGCGKSEGSFADHTVTGTIDDICSAVEMLKKKGFRKISLYGISTGALSAMKVCEKIEIENLVLKSPAYNYAERIQHFAFHGRILSTSDPMSFLYSDPDDVVMPMCYNFLEDARQYSFQRPLVNTLVVHGTEDKTFPIEDIREWTAELPSARLIEVVGANHYWNKKDTIKATEIITDWLVSAIETESTPEARVKENTSDEDRLATTRTVPTQRQLQDK